MNPRLNLQRAAIGAVLVKILLASFTLGTNDVDAFYNFGRFISEHGLIAQYRDNPEFNHTPLIGWFCAGIYALGKGACFPLLLRLPGIIADFLSVCILLKFRGTSDRPPWWALALFALSPANFMVSGFHGNVDSVLAWLLLLAVWQGVRGRPVACGLVFGLACQVKVIPLLLAPALFFFWWQRGRTRPFFASATATILAGWSVPLLTIPAIFVRNVLGYSSNWGSWGISWALHATGAAAFAPVGMQDPTAAQVLVTSALKMVIVGGTLWLAWTRRVLTAAHLPGTCALIWAVFFVFAPGVGAQYLVWLAPFLVLHSARWFAVVTVASAAFLCAFYNTINGGLPWWHGVSTRELLPEWVAWTSLPWLALIAFLASSGSQSSSSSSPSSVDSSGGRS